MTIASVRAALAQYAPLQVEAPEAKPAAVALMLLGRPKGLETLFIKRAERAGDPWSRQVALPGGRREPEDADLFVTAVRETLEETGIDLAQAERLGALDDLYPRTPTLPPVVVRPFVFALADEPAIVPNAEVEHAFWVPLERFVTPGVRRDVTLQVRGVERVFPAYDLGDEVIWGMTERILTPFLELIGYTA
jgi:8-oxo-dGTP pyrophosphatase MutT (NUDIX family)